MLLNSSPPPIDLRSTHTVLQQLQMRLTQMTGYIMLCSHLTSAFAAVSTSPGNFNIASMVTQTQTQNAKKMEDISPFCPATDSPVLDFW